MWVQVWVTSKAILWIIILYVVPPKGAPDELIGIATANVHSVCCLPTVLPGATKERPEWESWHCDLPWLMSIYTNLAGGKLAQKELREDKIENLILATFSLGELKAIWH